MTLWLRAVHCVKLFRALRFCLQSHRLHFDNCVQYRKCILYLFEQNQRAHWLRSLWSGRKPFAVSRFAYVNFALADRTETKMSCKSSPSNESHLVSSSSRSTMLNEETLSRDFSLASITSSSTSQQDEYYQYPDHAEIALRNMRNHLDNRLLCDVTLIAGIDGKR